MLTLQIILKLVFMLSVLGAGAMAVVHHIRGYRILAALALGAVVVGTTLEFGAAGFLIVSAVVGIVMPVALNAAGNFIIWLAWQPVRRRFPNEPKQPPVKPLTVGAAYRLLWLA